MNGLVGARAVVVVGLRVGRTLGSSVNNFWKEGNKNFQMRVALVIAIEKE